MHAQGTLPLPHKCAPASARESVGRPTTGLGRAGIWHTGPSYLLCDAIYAQDPSSTKSAVEPARASPRQASSCSCRLMTSTSQQVYRTKQQRLAPMHAWINDHVHVPCVHPAGAYARHPPLSARSYQLPRAATAYVYHLQGDEDNEQPTHIQYRSASRSAMHVEMHASLTHVASLPIHKPTTRPRQQCPARSTGCGAACEDGGRPRPLPVCGGRVVLPCTARRTQRSERLLLTVLQPVAR